MTRPWKFFNKVGANGQEDIELRIDGEIVDTDDIWLYEWFGIAASSPNKFRRELNKYKGKDIKVWIDSYGGSVYAAAGMYNALRNHDGKITTIVDSKAMSAASVVLMAGDERFGSPVGVTMIHNPLTRAEGDARVMRKAAEVLDTVKEIIINAYMRSGKTKEEISVMMDDETWMSANVALKEGFIDKILFEDEPVKVENIKDFSFNRLAIVNSANNAANRIFSMGLNQKESDEKMEIKNVKDLKSAYPNLIKEIEDTAKKEGAEQERIRIKDIEEISLNVDPTLLNKAKFEKPIDAKELAFEALKADNKKGEEFLNGLEDDTKNSGIDDVKNLPVKEDIKNEKIDKEGKEIADMINKKRGLK